MLHRRDFLSRSSLLSLAPWVPAFLPRIASAVESKRDDRVLVVIQLSGGNDGLNTVIPYEDENYARYRQELRIPSKEILPIENGVGLHPAMQAAADLIESERLGIIPGVGYPNPNRSHFRSMAIWHAARLNAREHTGQGWLGRSLDGISAKGQQGPGAVYVGDGSIPAAIFGRRADTIAHSDQKELALAARLNSIESNKSSDGLDQFVRSTLDNSYTAARQFSEALGDGSSGSGPYPTGQLAQHLKLAAKIIRMGLGTRIVYLQQPGYDTHAGQKFPHERLLRAFSRSLAAFLDDLKRDGLSERVLVLAFSEFGRRVKENDSAGTDHGTSGPVFIAGDAARTGLLSPYPSLSELVDEDLAVNIDFRRIYASVLNDWLNLPATEALGGTFEPFPVTATS